MQKNAPFLLVLLLLLLIAWHSITSTTPPSQAPALQRQNTQEHSIQGSPSLSASFIDHLLCAARSPACNTGQDLYSLGKRYGIDPAYALAFFWHESEFGRLGVASENKGLGNIRCTSGYVCANGFRVYQSWQDGYNDWYQLMSWYITTLHKSTIETIVPTYAPSSENDTPAYIQAVLTSVTTWRKQEHS